MTSVDFTTNIVQLDIKDNVLVALKNIKKGDIVHHQENQFALLEDIPAKHKFNMYDLNIGDPIYMYGVLVGKAVENIPACSLLTEFNIKHAAEPYSYKGFNYQWQKPDVSKYQNKFFNGFHRKDGKVGTANYWLFIPTVFCENRNLDVIKETMNNQLGYAVHHPYENYLNNLVKAYHAKLDLNDHNIFFQPKNTNEKIFENVDGIKFLTHQGGCGGTRQDSDTLSNLLAAYANHPNVGGITVLSLGCQHLQVNDFLRDLKKQNPKFDKPLYIFEQQQTKSEQDLIQSAIQKTFEGLIEINKISRKPSSLENLCIGVKCGGSDGFSGVSANPAVGYTSDLLVALGGKVLLAEFPELCGAEQNMLDRCENPEIAQKFIDLMEAYDAQAHRAGSGFFMNPSPGNIKDGLITDAIKSAGAAKKGGTAPIIDVLDYTEIANKPGLHLVCTPGNDVEATTGKTASGANLILFTTGLGTPTGNPICPVIKIATNSDLAKRMADIIDIDCGPIIDGKLTIEQMGEQILDYCIEVASGNIIPKAVLLQQDDFIPWKRGVSL